MFTLTFRAMALHTIVYHIAGFRLRIDASIKRGAPDYSSQRRTPPRSQLGQHSAALDTDAVFQKQANPVGIDAVLFVENSHRKCLRRVVVEDRHDRLAHDGACRSEEHTSEL